MRPVRPGDRGAAVEDIQKRLLALGHDLGPTGIDGVFLGQTLAAVTSYQRDRMLDEDGLVGPSTWAALVDDTFVLGDRMLYLRFPHLHGRDVRTLQGALNALGFACGRDDGVFGTFTERAVREFQLNTGQPIDGIAGADTIRAVTNLRHVWTDKDPQAPVALHCGPARAAELLAETSIAVASGDEVGRYVSERLANLAHAAQPAAQVEVVDGADIGATADVWLVLMGTEREDVPGVPEVDVEPGDDVPLAVRLVAALGARGRSTPVRIVLRGIDMNDEHALQRAAVRLLDALCSALAEHRRSARNVL